MAAAICRSSATICDKALRRYPAQRSIVLLIEQRRRIVQAADNPPIGLSKVERQVELGCLLASSDPANLQARQIKRPALIVLPGEHHLEHRRMAQAAHRLDQIHNLLKRKVLMGLGFQSYCLDPLQQGL